MLDEEPPLTIYSECLLRTMDTSGTGTGNGLVLTTFTPLQGLSDTVLHFLPDGQIPDYPVPDGRYIVNASWDDVPHLDAATKSELLAAIPAYQRDARTRGIPVLAAGVIYPVPEDTYLIDPVALAPHWKRAYGMDVGWNRTAAIWGAYDQDSDTWYLYSEHYHSHAEPSVHAAGIRGRGEWIPGVIDPASRGRSAGRRRQLLEDYQQLGLTNSPRRCRPWKRAFIRCWTGSRRAGSRCSRRSRTSVRKSGCIGAMRRGTSSRLLIIYLTPPATSSSTG